MSAIWDRFRKSSETLTDRLDVNQWDIVHVIVVILGLAVVGTGGYFLGWPAWRHWQNRRSLVQAGKFERAGDYRSLILALRRATQLAPNDPATWRETAGLLGQINSPESLIARQRLVQLAPEDVALRLALAKEAIKFARLDVAQSALAGVGAAGRQGVAFHRLAASLAAAQGRTGDLEVELKAVLAASPGDLDAGFGYATLRLWGTDPIAASAARAELDHMLLRPSLRIRAAIELISEASSRGDPRAVVDVLNLLLTRFAPGVAGDFSSPAVPGWTGLLAGMKAAAAPTPADVALMARWLAGLGRWSEAVTWLDSLPPAVQTADAVADVAAQLSAEHDDFTRLGRLLRAGAWGTWPPEAQTLAIASRIQVLHFSRESGRLTWADAMAASDGSPAGLKALARLGSIWGDRDGEELVLKTVLRHDPDAFWAYDASRTLYLAKDDLPRLWDLYGAWCLQFPDDPAIAAARTMLGCVLDRVDPNAITAAAQLRTRFPDSLPAQVAYAAALWRGGREVDAWRVLAALPPAARERRDVSFWVALIQADLGHVPEATAALRRVMPEVTSREERTLLEIAAAKVGYIS
jgi:hypothetical protein